MTDGVDIGTSILDQASAFHVRGEYEKAIALYDQLLTQNHDNAGLLAMMGTACIHTDRLGLAISLLERSTSRKPDGDAFCNLGIAYKQSGQYAKCHEAFRKALSHNPSPNTVANYSALFINVGEPQQAIKYAMRAIQADPECSMAYWSLGMGQLELGLWKEGWESCEWGFEARMRVRRNIGDKPYWDGTEGKTIAVYGEQGIGDEIMFASMLPDLMAKNTVILECHPRLKTMFEKSFPGLICYGTREHPVIDWWTHHDIDYAVSIGSLGKWFRNTREAFPGTPYLKADALPNGEKFRVGISWTGGLKEGRVRTRSIPLARWKSILNVPNVEFVSLQYTDSDAEIDLANAEGYVIRKMPEAKADDYYETARLVASCDLVISVCTSVVHLAGALGVPCWCAVPSKPAWRYGVSGGMPWYRSVRLYRQPKGDTDAWRPVIELIGSNLADLMDANRQQRKVA